MVFDPCIAAGACLGKMWDVEGLEGVEGMCQSVVCEAMDGHDARL